MAVIILKNALSNWFDPPLHPQEEKEYVYNNIILLLRFDIAEKVRVQFEEIAYNLSQAVFPWQGMDQ